MSRVYFAGVVLFFGAAGCAGNAGHFVLDFVLAGMAGVLLALRDREVGKAAVAADKLRRAKEYLATLNAVRLPEDEGRAA